MIPIQGIVQLCLPCRSVGWIWDGKAYTTLTVPSALPVGAHAAPYGINNPGKCLAVSTSGRERRSPSAGLDLADSGEILAASFMFHPVDQSALIDKGRTLPLPSFPGPSLATIYMGMNARRDLAGFRVLGDPPLVTLQAVAVFRLRP